MRAEAKVGLFVLLGFFALFALSTRVQTVASFGKAGYELHAQIPVANGLEPDTIVRINGVEAGYIQSLAVRRGQVWLTLFIYEGNEIAEDSLLVVAQESLLGGNYINILYGHSDRLLEGGDEIKNIKMHAAIDEAIDEIQRFAANLNDTFDADTRHELQRAISEFRQMAEGINTTADEFTTTARLINERLPAIMAQIDDLSREFAQMGSTVNDRLPQLVQKFEAIEDELLAILEENREPIGETLASVNTFFQKGSDTLEGIDEMVGKANQAQLEVDLNYQHQLGDGYGRSVFGVAYRPNPSNYYMLDLTSTADLSRTDAQGDVVLPDSHDEGVTLISAQMGKRYDDWRLRAGVIESTGGVGLDRYAQADRLRLSMDLYDFNAINDLRGENPHLRFSARYLPWKHLGLYGGYDNILNSDAAGFFMGAGVHFVDDDLKQLLFSAAGAI
jgi:phospholipid/cholesterol/gamma-HCH transport system substrate-binding protein